MSPNPPPSTASAPAGVSMPNPNGSFYIDDPAKIPKAKIKRVLEDNKALREELAHNTALLTEAADEIEALQTQIEQIQGTERYIVLNLPDTSVYKKEQFRAYRFELKEPQCFANDDEYTGLFSKIVMVTRREHEKEFLWHEMSLWLNDDQMLIVGQTAKVWFVRTKWYNLDGEMIPVFFSVFTLADTQHFLDTAIAAEAHLSIDDFRYIHMLTMEAMVVEMQSNHDRFDKIIATKEALKDKAEADADELRKDVVFKVESLDSDTRDKIDLKTKIQIYPWQFWLLLLGWVGFVAMLVWAIASAVFTPAPVTPATPTNSTQPTAMIASLWIRLFHMMWRY